MAQADTVSERKGAVPRCQSVNDAGPWHLSLRTMRLIRWRGAFAIDAQTEAPDEQASSLTTRAGQRWMRRQSVALVGHCESSGRT